MPFSNLIHSPTVQMILILVVGMCLLLLLVRFALGPTPLDRLVALDSFAIVLLCLAAVWGVHIGTAWFYDLILLLSLVGFLSTIALARFFDQGSVDDD